MEPRHPIRYRPTRTEMETTITFDAEEKIAHIYTADPVYIRKFDKLTADDPETWHCVEVDALGYYKRYEAPADRIRFRKAASLEMREANKRNGAQLTASVNPRKEIPADAI